MHPRHSAPQEGAVAHNLQINRLHAGLQAITANLIAPFASLLALKMDATNLQLGALNALPNLLTFLFTLPIIARLDRLRRHGPLLGRTFLASRLLLLAVAAAPFFKGPLAVWLLVMAWGLHNFPFNAASSVMQGYLADVLPPAEVGNALAQRGAVATAAATVTVMAMGVLLDHLPFPAGYQGVAVAGCLLGLGEVFIFSRFAEPERLRAAGPPPGSWWREMRGGITALRADRPFISFLTTAVAFNFSWQLVWPVFSRYQVDVLRANNFWLAVLSVAGSLGGVFSFGAWVRRAERTNPAAALALAAAGLAVAPVANLLSPDMAWLSLFQLLIGAAVAGATVLLQQGSLAYAPPAQRSLYLAVLQTGMMLAASVAPLLGGWLIDVVGLRQMLVTGFVLRCLTALLWWRLGRRPAPLPAV